MHRLLGTKLHKPLLALAAHVAGSLVWARNVLERTARAAAPPKVAMLELLSSAWLSQAVIAAAQLGLADALGEQPESASEIARRLGLSEDGVRRLLRALAQHGIFTLLPDGRFAASALSNTLRTAHPNSIRDFALFLGSPTHREHWSSLAHAVASGESQIARLRGRDFFTFARDEAAFGSLFGRAMSNLSRLSREFLLPAYDFASLRSVVDVGGGEGSFLSSLLARTPSLHGVLFDLPEVIARAESNVPTALRARMTFARGSFFERFPAGHDAYVLKHVLHDWDDAQARRILERAGEALSSRRDGKVLLVEMVLPANGLPHVGKLFDLEMLLSVGGRERTRTEFERLLRSAGFVVKRVVSTASPLCILEAQLA